MSPSVKINVTAMRNAITAFPQIDHIRALGRVIDAS